MLATALQDHATNADTDSGDIMKRTLLVTVFIAALGLLAWPFVALVRDPHPAGRIVIATGGADGLYHDLAETYRPELVRFGVDLVTRPDLDGFNTLKALVVDADSGVTAGFVKGGFVGGQQGRLASEEDRQWHEKDVAALRSVGRLFVEPLWVFTRRDETLESLRAMAGKKVLIGDKRSGARKVVAHLLAANEVTKANATLIEDEIDASGAPLISGQIDVAFLLLPPESPKVQKLLRNPALRVMDFAGEAEAYVNRFPYLTKVVMNKGAVEFSPTTPDTDVTLIATTAALVVRKDLHPALVSLLTNAVLRHPKSGFDKRGDPILFYRAGEFPSASDSEFETLAEARAVHASKDLPVLMRSIGPGLARFGAPFAVTAFISEHGTQLALALIPLLSILLPLARLAPAAYNWTIRRRLLAWYRRLKAVERRIKAADTPVTLAAAETDLDAIETGVGEIRVPLAFSSQLYDLRMHINVVRQRLATRTSALAKVA